MNENNVSPGRNSFAERRKKADFVVNMATILSVLSWAFALGVWMVLDVAAPQRDNILLQFFDAPTRTWWDASLLPIAFVFLILSFILCVAAFFFNMARMRRKTDKYRKSIIIIACITFIGLVTFIIRFGAYMF